jgi:hypothetical protein
MSDFSIRAPSVDVEEIMRHIKTRISDKRGVDYTEQQIQELATVKLETFLDANNIRSDLREHYKRSRPAAKHLLGEFEDQTQASLSRGFFGRFLTLVRKILTRLLRLNPIINALHIQEKINQSRHQNESLNYELLNNLVVEITKLGIEVKNLKMQVVSLNSRLDFNERRERALENVVAYQPGTGRRDSKAASRLEDAESVEKKQESAETKPEPRRRRRRRGRRRPTGDYKSATGAGTKESVASAPPAPESVASAPPAPESVASAPPAPESVASAPPAPEPVASAPPAPEPVASAPPAPEPAPSDHPKTEAPKAGAATESDHGDSDVVKP